MEIRVLRIAYGRLLGIRELLVGWERPNIESEVAISINSIINIISSSGVSEARDLAEFPVLRGDKFDDYVSKNQLLLCVNQAIAVLEYGYGVKDQVVQIGSLYNAIKDNQLRDRCADLLASDDHFDRVVNQATLVLEDRIRKKVGGSDFSGTQLSNNFIKSDPIKSPIVFSSDAGEQEGYSNLFRGVFLALRNGTHHQISDDFSREDAFVICGFIDRLLRMLEAASFRADVK